MSLCEWFSEDDFLKCRITMPFIRWWKSKLHCLLRADLCEDIEVKQQIVEIIEMVRNRHKKVIREGATSMVERRRSSARRYYIHPHVCFFFCLTILLVWTCSASEMTYIVLGGALNYSLTPGKSSLDCRGVFSGSSLNQVLHRNLWIYTMLSVSSLDCFEAVWCFGTWKKVVDKRSENLLCYLKNIRWL